MFDVDNHDKYKNAEQQGKYDNCYADDNIYKRRSDKQ